MIWVVDGLIAGDVLSDMETLVGVGLGQGTARDVTAYVLGCARSCAGGRKGLGARTPVGGQPEPFGGAPVQVPS